MANILTLDNLPIIETENKSKKRGGNTEKKSPTKASSQVAVVPIGTNDNVKKTEAYIENFCSKYGIVFKSKQPYMGGVEYLLETCLFNEKHKEDSQSSILILENGAISYHCYHNSCQDKTWRDVRWIYEPEKVNQEEVKKILATNNNQVPKNTMQNVVCILKNDICINGLAYNEFSNCPCKKKQFPWDVPLKVNALDPKLESDDLSELRVFFSQKYELETTGDKISDAIVSVSRETRFNPLTDKLDKIFEKYKAVDTTGAVEVLLDYIGAPHSKYNVKMLEHWLLGAVCRAYHQGCKFDYLLCLIGDQGGYKSTFFNKLAFFDDWFIDDLGDISKGKESVENIRGKWIVEIGENVAFDKATVETAKSFISRKVDTYRKPYARESTDHPRCCVLGVTTNKKDFLRDTTGNRRYLPIDCDNTQISKSFYTESAEIDIERAYAEVLKRYKSENFSLTSLKLPDDMLGDVYLAQLAHTVKSDDEREVEEYLKYLITHTNKEQGPLLVCVQQVLSAVFDLGQNEKATRAYKDAQRVIQDALKNNKLWESQPSQHIPKFGTQRPYKYLGELPDFVESDLGDIPF